MQLTKYTHSCVLVQDGPSSIVIDPGVFGSAPEALARAQAVLITHEHPDHLDEPALRAAYAASHDLQIYAPAPVAQQLADLGSGVHPVEPGQTLTVAGQTVETFGGQHALIHLSIPQIPNIGYLIGGLYHPGDALYVPPAEIATLLLPINAPWSKLAEVIDYTVAVRAPRVHPIHDGLVNERGIGIPEAQVTRIAAQYGVTYTHLDVGDIADV